MTRPPWRLILLTALCWAMLMLFSMNEWHRAIHIAASCLLGLFIGQYWSYLDLRREHADRLDAIVLQSRFILEHFIQWPRDKNGRIVVPQLKEGENEISEWAEEPP